MSIAKTTNEFDGIDAIEGNNINIYFDISVISLSTTMNIYMNK